MFNLLTNLYTEIDKVVQKFIFIPAAILATGIGIFAISFVSAWGIYKSYLVMIGMSSESFKEILKDFAIKIAIITFAITVPEYTNGFIMPIKDSQEALGTEMVQRTTSSLSVGNNSFSAIEASIDEVVLILTSLSTGKEPEKSNVDKVTEKNGGEPVGFVRWGWNAIQDLFSETVDTVVSALNLGAFFAYLAEFLKAIIIMAGLLILSTVLFVNIIINKILFYVSLGVGPLFILFAAFNVTKNYFFSWLSTTLGYMFSYILIMIVFSGLMSIYKSLYSTGKFTFTDAFSCFILCVIFSLIIQRVSNIASSYFGAGNISDAISNSVVNFGKNTLSSSANGMKYGAKGGKKIYDHFKNKSNESNIKNNN